MADEKIITSSVFEQSVTEIMQDIANNLYEFEEYTEEEVANLIDLSEEEVAELTRVINDTTVALNKVYSNKKVEDLLSELEVTCNKYADEKIGGLAGIHLAYVDTLPTTGEDNTIYILKSTTGGNDTLNLYDGTSWISIGEFSISLDNYYDKTEIDALLNDKANANEVINQNDVVSDMSNISSSTVLSTAGLEVELNKKANLDDMTTELDKKVDKDSIATVLDDSVTNEQVASAKVVYDNAIKNKNLKTFTTFEQLGITIGSETLTSIVEAMPDNSIAILNINANCNTVYPQQYGTLYISRVDSGRVFIRFETSPDRDNFRCQEWVSSYGRGAVNTWREVCTTTVADVPVTSVTLPNGCTGTVSYCVKNGICFVTLVDVTVSDDSDAFLISNKLPKNCGAYSVGLLSDIAGNIYGRFSVSSGVGDLYVRVYDNTKTLSGSFSYPVAE